MKTDSGAAVEDRPPTGNPRYGTKTASTLIEALNICLEQRAKRFCSFRGHRRKDWKLGLHGIVDDASLDRHFRQFKLRCMEFPPPHYIEEWDELRWLYYAQHHGLKTRLLDWTKDPLVAIYFAVENILSHGDDETDFGAIWVLHVHHRNFLYPTSIKAGTAFQPQGWMLIDPPPVTPRLARQSGLFSFHAGPNSLVPIEDQDRREDEVLTKIEIVRDTDGANPSRKIREQLGIMNIHHASLFSDPDGIAQFTNYEWPIIGVPPKS